MWNILVSPHDQNCVFSQRYSQILNTATRVGKKNGKKRISAVQKMTSARVQEQDVNNNEYRTAISKSGFFSSWNNPLKLSKFQAELCLNSTGSGVIPALGNPGSTSPLAAQSRGFPRNQPKSKQALD